MKNRKGFTLIELLAIIVILAIIAVITVPIILGIIDDAQKKAVKDSGFKMAFVGGNVQAKRTNDKFLIPRYPIINDITMDQFISKIK